MFLSLISTLLSAQPQDLYFHHLTPANGLSQSTSGSIYRDSRGFVWIGTADGLNRFDGTRVKIFGVGPHQLADPTIGGRIVEDERSDLWFSTLTALHHYRRQSDDFEHFTYPDGQGGTFRNFHVFHLDRQGRIWLEGNGQVFLFDLRLTDKATGHFRRLPAASGAAFRFFEQDSLTGNGILYALNETGTRLYAWHGDTLVFSGEIPLSKPRDVWPDRQGRVWMSNDSALWCWNRRGESWCFRSFEGQPVEALRRIEPWGNRYLFVAGSTGLYLFDKSTLQFIRHWAADPRNPAALATNLLSVIYIDREDNLWLSSWTKGIDFTSLRKLKFQTARYYLGNQPGQGVLFVPGPLLEDNHRRLWCGSQMCGLLALSPDRRQYADFSALAPQPEQLLALPDGSLLVNNFKDGLCRLNPETKTAIPLRWLKQPVTSYHLCPIRPGQFLLTPKERPGLLKLTVWEHDYRFEPVGMPAIQAKEWLKIIPLSDQARLLLDGNYTVYYFREKPNPELTPLTTLPGYFNCFLDNDSSVWLGGSFGILQVDKATLKCRYVSTQEGLPDHMVYAMVKAGPDDYWLSTNKGLVRFRPSDRHFQTFSAADGLQAMEYNRASSLRTADGTLWFGGIGGYNFFRPADIHPLTTLPTIQIVDIQINDRPYYYPDNPTERRSLYLPYDSSTLTFHFAALEFSDPANNRLRYRMRYADGQDFDHDWIYCADAKGFARYTKLPPGKYKLLIEAANSDGVWNPAPKEFFIEITPPFYQTWWFLTLAALTSLLLIFAFYRARLTRMRKKEEQKRKMIELELNALRTQMNPHFISNNLVSINHFIRNNGVEKVRAYVATFARLMRNVLESARHPVVSLQDELQMLQNFVEVESGRFPQPIDFETRVEAGIDPDRIFLPGMLLQPFVENAIVHGIGPRNGTGYIRVQVAREPGALVFTIEDDGVGRKAPQTTGDLPDRRSHGLDITRERLQLYDLQHHTTSSIATADLRSADGRPLGTRIILRLGLA